MYDLHKNGLTLDEIILHNIFISDNLIKINNGQAANCNFSLINNLNNDEENDSTFTMAPELLLIDDAKGEKVDVDGKNDDSTKIKADLWCLGVIYYKMIFGHYPFQSYCKQKLYELIVGSE